LLWIDILYASRVFQFFCLFVLFISPLVILCVSCILLTSLPNTFQKDRMLAPGSESRNIKFCHTYQ